LKVFASTIFPSGMEIRVFCIYECCRTNSILFRRDTVYYRQVTYYHQMTQCHSHRCERQLVPFKLINITRYTHQHAQIFSSLLDINLEGEPSGGNGVLRRVNHSLIVPNSQTFLFSCDFISINIKQSFIMILPHFKVANALMWDYGSKVLCGVICR